jgi:chemosensory pili system protein ChpC
MKTAEQNSATAQQAPLLRVLLIPLEETSVLIPNTAVAEVIESKPQIEPAAAGAPAWVVGTLGWRGLAVPVIRFEAVAESAYDPGGAVGRVVVLNTLNGNRALPFMALAMSGLPRLMQIGGDDLATTETGEPVDGILRRVRVDMSNAIIPDLDWLETQLVDSGVAVA